MSLSGSGLRTYRIYALMDPRTNRPRYVGQTADSLEARRSDHVQKQNASAKSDWVRSLLVDGLEPVIVPLEEFFGHRRQAYGRETAWIRRLRSAGHDLLNVP